MKAYYMGLDNGGTSCKAVLFDNKGNEVCSAGRMLAMITPHPLHTERDMKVLWEKNIECISEVIRISGIEAKLIRGVACSGHGKGLYVLDKEGNPVRNGIVSTDGRAASYVDQWEQDGTASQVFERNYQKILACQPVSLLRWMKDHEPENYNNIRWVFAVKDYIRYCLTGEAYSEITDYSGSNLLDLTNRAYSQDLFDLFSISEMFDCMPPLKGSADICGYVTKEVFALTGLPEGIPVAGGMFDIDACSIAMNIVDSNYLCVIAGTWSINEYIARKPVLNQTVMMNSYYCYDDYFLIEESSPTSAGNLEWYINRFMGKEKVEAKAQGMNIYAFCDRLVESVKPEDGDIIFLPYLYGSNYNPSSKACFLGMSSHHTQAHMVRAVFEGIVFCHMVHIEKLLMNRTEFKSIRLAGGAANSAVWAQMFADVTGYPVEVVGVKELGALGSAMVAAVACNDFGDLKEASRAMSTVGRQVLPGPGADVYKQRFARYKAISQDMEKYFG